jgi:hypothetical protein
VVDRNRGRWVLPKSSAPKGNKAVRTEALKAVDGHIVWRFGRLDKEGEFGWQNLSEDCLVDLERELEEFQSRPLSVLRRELKWLKYIGSTEMAPAAQKRLSQIANKETGLWQLHLGHDRWRVWGYFEDPEYYFVWWDPDHLVCPGKYRRHRNADG